MQADGSKYKNAGRQAEAGGRRAGTGLGLTMERRRKGAAAEGGGG